MKNVSIGFFVGASVTGLLVVGSTYSVGALVGGGFGEDVGRDVVGLRVGGGVAGRHPVNAIQVIPSEHSVSWPLMQGSWQFLFASAQPLPHQ